MIRRAECALTDFALTTQQPDTLYYDGQYPLCSYAMDHLRKLGDDSLRLVDTHGDLHAKGLDEDAPDHETLLGVLHLKSRDGEWLRGVDASVRARQSTRIGWIWKALRSA